MAYDKLSDGDKERYEEDFIEDGGLPDFIPSGALNRFVFSETTVDTVLQDLMDRGIRVEGGDRIGKTIIFAQNKRHAEIILERFNKLYPQYKGKFAQRVICDDAYAQTTIDEFKVPNKPPFIAVSVDMMDTGIDVPECVNLVFFKKVRSKIKFWQMIGWGTRLCPALTCTDAIDGEYTGKKRFLIFDYCGNFAFFRVNKKGYDSSEVKSLSENIFCKRVQLMAMLETAGPDEALQSWREELVTVRHEQVTGLRPELIAVKLRLRYVEKYRERSAFAHLSKGDKTELTQEIAPLVQMEDPDEYAKRFDNFMYGLMLAQMEQSPALKRARKQLQEIAAALEKKGHIPQIKGKLPLIREINTDEFWDAGDVLASERVRKELRGLIQFIVDEAERRQVITKLDDPVIAAREGEALEQPDDFEDYRAKVNRYITDHGDALPIYKLTHNVPLTETDYQELERVLTQELGSREDYTREFRDTPFGLLVRKIAKLDHDAAMQAFSAFIDDQSLNQEQIAFVRKVISHIEQNGYMESVTDLTRPPFDRPVSFLKLFDPLKQGQLIETISTVRDNAVHIVA